MRVHKAFNAHVSKLSRLSTRLRRSKTRRFVHAKRQCASPESFKPSHPKPPGRLDPTKSNSPSLKVPEIPIKTRLVDPCQYFHSFSKALPVDAPFIQIGRLVIFRHFHPPQSAVFTRFSHSLQAPSCPDRAHLAPQPFSATSTCVRSFSPEPVYVVSTREISSPSP